MTAFTVEMKEAAASRLDYLSWSACGLFVFVLFFFTFTFYSIFFYFTRCLDSGGICTGYMFFSLSIYTAGHLVESGQVKYTTAGFYLGIEHNLWEISPIPLL